MCYGTYAPSGPRTVFTSSTRTSNLRAGSISPRLMRPACWILVTSRSKSKFFTSNPKSCRPANSRARLYHEIPSFGRKVAVGVLLSTCLRSGIRPPWQARATETSPSSRPRRHLSDTNVSFASALKFHQAPESSILFQARICGFDLIQAFRQTVRRPWSMGIDDNIKKL